MIHSGEVYKNLLSTDGEYGGSVEFTCISRLISNFLPRVQYENSANTVDYGTDSIVCHLLFSGIYDVEHFDALQEQLM